MGYDYSYQCTKATVREDLGTDAKGDRMVFCDMEFENEHGHAMQPVQGIVVLREYGATIATDAEDILPELPSNCSDDELFAWDDQAEKYHERLLLGDVGYDIYNQEEIAEAIRLQLAVR